MITYELFLDKISAVGPDQAEAGDDTVRYSFQASAAQLSNPRGIF
jgi:hypothetical protein